MGRETVVSRPIQGKKPFFQKRGALRRASGKMVFCPDRLYPATPEFGCEKRGAAFWAAPLSVGGFKDEDQFATYRFARQVLRISRSKSLKLAMA